MYRLRLAATVYGYTDSFTEYEFVTNLPPYGGSCGINPSTGELLLYMQINNFLKILFKIYE